MAIAFEAVQGASVRVRIDGRAFDVPRDFSALRALRQAGLDVPTLCHDPRLKPSASCRACLVRVKGMSRPVCSCSLPVEEGMEITVRSEELDEARKGVLRMLAREYPVHYVSELPEEVFHQHLIEAGLVEEMLSRRSPPSFGREEIDDSNPYFRFDPSACIECYKCVRVCEELQGERVWQIMARGPFTKIFPNSGTNLAESTCRSCGACVDVCPTAALVDKTRLESGPAEAWTRTTCPYCGVGCELWIGAREGKVVLALPVVESPVNKGHLCVKGRYAHQFNHSPDRLTTPLIRRNGAFVEASWDEAIRFVADGFRRILDQHGPAAIGVLGSARAPNEDNYLAQKFARVVLGTNNVDCCARVCHGPTAAAMKAMLGTGAATNSFDDLESARTIMVCGSNSRECHPVVGERILQARENGANLIVIDPRKTDLARVADIHVQLRPGANVPLFNAIACAILEEGLADESFLSSRVSEVEEFSAFIGAFQPERVAAICGVAPETIRAAARLYATAKPSMCFHGLGMTEHLQGTEGVMCMVNLALLTGNMGKAGAGINPLRGQNNVQGSAHMGCEPSNLTGFVSIPDGRELFESVWGRPVPEAKGLNLMNMVDEAAAGRFKALWAIGYDVFFTNANAPATRKAFESMEFVVLQDLFLNETAKEFAHVVLPAASSFERDGTFMNAERRVSRVRKAVEPPGEAKPDWEIVQLVARQMGFKREFAFESAEEIWEEVRKVWKPGAGMSYRRLEEHGLQWPCTDESHPGTTVLHKERFPIGERAALKRIAYEPTPEVVSEEFPFLLHTGRSLYHFNAGTMTMRTKNREIRSTDCLDLHPSDALRLALQDGQTVRIVSRHGSAVLPVRFDYGIRLGEAFTTFHDPAVFVNQATSPIRDKTVGAPEYKVCAIRLEKELIPQDQSGNTGHGCAESSS